MCSSDLGAKAVVLRLTTTAAGGATLTALPDPDGSAWVTDAAIPIGGTWDATIAVRIDTFTQATGGCTLVLGA